MLPLSAIPPSELILNSRGAIYHLDLLPDELAETIITVGDPDRVGMISSRFDRIEVQRQHREFVTHTGYIGGQRLSVISTGIGPDNIDIVLNELDALVNINLQERSVKDRRTSLNIIRLGTCGGLHPELDVDTVVMSSFGIGLDNLLHFYPYEQNPEEGFIKDDFERQLMGAAQVLRPYVAEGSIRLRAAFADKFTHGFTITCPGFYAPQGRHLRGGLRFPKMIDAVCDFESRGDRVVNFEMETSAIYGLGRMLGHQCLSLSVIVANRRLQTFTPDGHRAVSKMIDEALPYLATL